MTDQRVLVIAETEDADEFENLARDHGLSAERLETRAEPVTTVTLVLIGAAATVATVVALIDRSKGGQVIDLRPGVQRAMYRSKDLMYGLVIILAVDGSVQVEVHEPRGMFGEVVAALAGVITDLGAAGVDAVSRVVEAKVGELGRVSSHPAPTEDR